MSYQICEIQQSQRSKWLPLTIDKTSSLKLDKAGALLDHVILVDYNYS